jgi:hypothetical protein
MSFKTQKEIWEALISGARIRHASWGNGRFLRLIEGFLCDHVCHHSDEYFGHVTDWSLYEEPKKMKTVTLYRYTYQELGHVFQTPWRSMPFDSNLKLLKTEEKQIEIEIEDV